ncbi:ABC transporter permease [Anaeropeptidivorans aminofermentans]|jgi:peptide/nickel transport system permease protein|uniref:ABC transporter permease n=1 Tax=Anaeropeptidivorans aminofermentans TaxID=2934315 RepID=UPI0020253362|nr:ABC transporter permease [Anaeropeptidivorans aminofermentans]MBE6013331.1 ABC transporter permease [Lachnospiraceae bacterium]
MSDNTKKVDVIEKKYKKKSQMGEIWHRLKKNKTAILGLIVFLLLILMALLAPVLYDYDTQVIKQNIPTRLMPPNAAHPFGTDEMGRDIMARVVYGSRMSLFIGFAAVSVSLLVGGFLGAISGYYGGTLDNVIMRFMDILLAIPGTLLAITIVAALGPSIFNLIIALSVSYIPNFARVVRGPVLTVRDVEFVEAAKAIGAKTRTIIFSHVLPNSMAPVIVQTTLNVASVILTIAGLSFLGLGIQPPMPEWGAMLSSGRTYIRDQSYMTLFPGLAIMLTILSLNLLGDGLRDALDPRLK